MRNMAVLHSPAFSYPLPVLVRVLFNLLIFKGKILYYNKYRKKLRNSGRFGRNKTNKKEDRHPDAPLRKLKTTNKRNR